MYDIFKVKICVWSTFLFVVHNFVKHKPSTIALVQQEEVVCTRITVFKCCVSEMEYLY
jgi:hypothetical protein